MRTLFSVCVALGVLAVTTAAQAYTYQVNFTATDIYGRPAKGVEVHVSCNAWSQYYDPDPYYGGSYWYNYTLESRAATDANGNATAALYVGDNDIYWSDYNGNAGGIDNCTYEMLSQDRKVDWDIDLPGGGTLVKKTPEPGIAYFSGGDLYADRVFNVTADNWVPEADAVLSYSCKTYGYEYRCATAHLFKSGGLDHNVVLLDGMDPTNDRGPYDMYGELPAVASLFASGVDVWIVNYRQGAETVRYHMDEAAIGLYNISQYSLSQGGTNWIDMVVGISESGNIGRSALAAMEHVRNYGPITSGPIVNSPYKSPFNQYADWFTYDEDYARRVTGAPVRAFINWDGPTNGVAALPVSFQLILRKMFSLSWNDLMNICNPKSGRLMKSAFGRGVAWIFGHKKYKAARSNWRNLQRLGAQLAATLDPWINGGQARDQMNNYCFATSANMYWWQSTCTSYWFDLYRSEVTTFNYNGGWPNQTRMLAFSQGSYRQHACDFPDEWGTGTCTGPAGYYNDPTTGTPDYHWAYLGSSPSKVKTLVPGDVFLRADLPEQCRNDAVELTLGDADVQPGSTTDLIGKHLTSLPGTTDIKFYVLPSYQATNLVLDMTSQTSGSHFNDVLWQKRPYTHQEVVASPLTVNFMMKYLYEYTLGDKDGFVTNAAIPEWGVYETGQVGKFCSVDPDDSNPNVQGWCASSVAQEPAYVCQPTKTTCESWECGDQPNGCGGTIYCGQCTYCGDYQCNGYEDQWSCPQDCGGGGTCYYNYGYCGDGCCDYNSGENYSCSYDCANSGSCNYNGYCESWLGETWQNCSYDGC